MAWLPQGADPFYEKYTPNNVLNERTKTRLEVLGKPILIDGDPKSDFGLQLRQLAQVLRSHGVKVVTRVVDESTDAAAVRRELAANLATGDDFVLVNYARRSMGQQGGGHISPLGAYDERSDSFLIMDVNPNRAPWVWVRSDAPLDCRDAHLRYGRKPRVPSGIGSGIEKADRHLGREASISARTMRFGGRASSRAGVFGRRPRASLW